MADKTSNNTFALITVVAIVAIVGMVMMFMQNKPTITSTGEQGLEEAAYLLKYTLDEENNQVGQASGQRKSTCTVWDEFRIEYPALWKKFVPERCDTV